jgi:hypothetical protein
MRARDYRDICGGGFLAVFGASAALYATTALDVGNIVRMGPGMFPAAVGCILAVLGVAILLPALFRSGEFPAIDWRSFLTILASILAFALMIRPFGMVPAIVAQTLIASRADSKLSLFGATVLAACVASGAALIFKVGLGAPVATVNWPW